MFYITHYRMRRCNATYSIYRTQSVCAKSQKVSGVAAQCSLHEYQGILYKENGSLRVVLDLFSLESNFSTLSAGTTQTMTTKKSRSTTEILTENHSSTRLSVLLGSGDPVLRLGVRCMRCFHVHRFAEAPRSTNSAPASIWFPSFVPGNCSESLAMAILEGQQAGH